MESSVVFGGPAPHIGTVCGFARAVSSCESADDYVVASPLKGASQLA